MLGSAAELGLEPGLTPLHDRSDETLDFLAGQRPFRMPEDHAEMDALHALGQVPPRNVSRYWTDSRVGPADRTTVSDSSAQGKSRATTSERSRTTGGNGGSGAILGHQPGPSQ